MNAVVVEDARLADAPAVAALEAECLGADAWSAALVTEGLSGRVPTVGYLVARTDGRTDGRVVGHAVVSYAGDIAELQRIAVTPACRHHGIGRALLAETVRRAGRAGAERLLLEVREDNEAARAFYAAAGFVALDRRPRYYRDGADAHVLQLQLTDGSAVAQVRAGERP